MNILRIVLTVIFVIDCIGLTVVVLMQEGKTEKVWVLFLVWRILTGDRIKVVPWKVIWFWPQRSWQFCYGTGNRIEYEILSDVKRTLLQLSCKGDFLHTERSDQQ